MRRTWFVLAILLMSFAFTGALYAQYEYYGPDYDIEDPRWNIHVGFGWLSGETEDDTTWIVGLDYETPIGNQYDDMISDYLTFGLDYIPISTLTTGDESIVPFLIGYRKYGIIPPMRVFFGIGVGARWASEDIPELEIDEGFDFAWSASIGFNFTPDFLGQIRFIGGNNPGDDGIFTVELGYRF